TAEQNATQGHGTSQAAEQNATQRPGTSQAAEQSSTRNRETSCSSTKSSLCRESSTLPEYDVKKILELLQVDANNKLKNAIKALFKNGHVVRRQRQVIVRALTSHLHFKIVSDPRDVTPLMEEGLARSFVLNFPEHKCEESQGSTSWAHFYAPPGTGFIQNCSRPIMRNHRQRKTRKGDEENVPPAPPHDIEDKILLLAGKVPGRAEKDAILTGMDETYRYREDARKNGTDITTLVQKFPHILSYDGIVLGEEFRRICPGANNFVLEFAKIERQILLLPIGGDLELDDIQHNLVKALLMICRQLPRDVRQKGDPKNIVWGKIEDVIVTVKVMHIVE
ncbi:Intraflagellar transport protein 172-like protein, partial [Frankliniella fusca]